MTETDTKTKILDTAQTLFAEHGFSATSIRQISTEAKVNLASINYHFNSKENLIYEVFARIVIPINQERLKTLDSILKKCGENPPPLDKVVEALIRPVLMATKKKEWKHGGLILKLFARLFVESDKYLRTVFVELFKEVLQRFTAAFKRALPYMDTEEFFWRIHFMIGVMAHSIDTHKIELISGGLCDPDDIELIVKRMVNFIVGGFKAPEIKKK